MTEARATLKAQGKPVPFGFQPLVSDEALEAILEAHAEGLTFNAIARRLDEQGFPTPDPRSKRWYPSTVAAICRREAVAS